MAFFNSTAGNDTFIGGLGIDTVSYAAASTGVVVSLQPAPGSANPPPQNTNHGIDTLISIESLVGSAFSDNLTGSAGNDTIDGGAGLGVDTLNGGAGIDTVSYASATAGINVSLSIAGVLQDTGGAGFDQLSNFENLTGSNFNDTLKGNAGNNVLNGGAGVDTVSYDNASAGVTVSLSVAGPQNTVGAGLDTLSNFENLTGSNFNDTLKGNAGNNVLNGGAGVDTVSYDNAGAGVTVSLSLAGQATGGAGFDTLSNFENLTGSNFNDTLKGNAGNNVLDGGAGVDTVSYDNAGAGVTVSLSLAGQATGGAGFDTLSNFENLTGSNFNDTLKGNASNNVLDGGAGVDTVSYDNALAGVNVSLSVAGPQNTVGAGLDTLLNFENLTGSNFNDTLRGNNGDNVIDGAGGIDTVSYDNAAAGVTVSLSLGTPQVTGGAGSDTLLNVENLTGSAFADTMSGNAGNNVLNGGAGIDTVSYANAGAGVAVNLGTVGPQNTVGAGLDVLSNFENLTGSAYGDTLTGNAGANAINGGFGNDTLVASAGVDTLTGGGGGFFSRTGGFPPLFVYTEYVDRFVFNSVADSPKAAPDVITDFKPSIGEKIDLSTIDANSSLLGNQAFTWVGSMSALPVPDLSTLLSLRLNQGELGYADVGADRFVIGNTSSGVGNTDFIVKLQGGVASIPGGLIASDIIL